MQADEGSSKPRPAGIVNSDPLWAQGRARLFRDTAMNALRPILFALSLSLAMTQAHAADTTFDTAFNKFTAFLEGSGGKIITIISLALGLAGMASGRFSLGQIALPVGVGIGVGTGVPIVTSAVTAII